MSYVNIQKPDDWYSYPRSTVQNRGEWLFKMQYIRKVIKQTTGKE